MAKNKIVVVCLLWLFAGIHTDLQGALSQSQKTKAKSEKEIRVSVIDTALSQIGVREATGKNDGKAVEKYLKVCGLGKGYAWCAAFISWVYKVNKVSEFKTAWAPGWFPKTKTVKHDLAEPGDVFGIWINNRIGHVGLVYVWGDKVVRTIEGNTNDAGSREGDGVYEKRRLRRQIYAVSKWIN